MTCILVISIQVAFGQIGIGTTSPETSSILDVSSNDKGVLFPRMTTAQRDGISNPVEGLVIYNIKEHCLQINIGTPSNPDWSCLGTSSSSSSAIESDCSSNGFEGAFVNGIPFTASNKFSVTITNNSLYNSTMTFSIADLVLSGVSGITVNAVSPTETTIVSGGSQVIEYSLIGTPSTTGPLTAVWSKMSLNCTKTFNIRNGDAHFTLPYTTVVLSVNDGSPLLDIQGVVDNEANRITVAIPYTEGSGGYDAYVGDYTPFNDGTGEPGENNSFRLKYPSGTFSDSGSISATIEVDGDGTFNAKQLEFEVQKTIATLDFKVNGNSKGHVKLDVSGGIRDRNFTDTNHRFVYIPVSAADGNIWLNNNLGANYSNVNHAQFNPTKQALVYNDSNGYGALFQWGRYADGHEAMDFLGATVGNPQTATLITNHATSINPNTAAFYAGDDSPVTQDFNWLDFGVSPNSVEDALWQGVSGTNNPCPQGYRLPTKIEMTNLIDAEAIINRTTAANSALALPSQGTRLYTNGAVNSVGSLGRYWTSSIGGANAYYYDFNGSGVSGSYTYRATAAAVRCLKH